MICDPPYNINVAAWDDLEHYVDWAGKWLREVERVLSPSGNFVLFGGLQYQSEAGSGDLLSLMGWMRAHSRCCSPISSSGITRTAWARSASSPTGMRRSPGLRRRQNTIFDLDAVRQPLDPQTLEIYKRDKRLNAESLDKGINPTNVWKIPRLNGNSKERVGHPTQKPKELIERIVRSLSFPGSTVLDFFAGSGVTSRVAIETRRHSISSDLDESFLTYFSRQLAQIETRASEQRTMC